MTRFIEYYEYISLDSYLYNEPEYFYMPVDKDAINKKDLDNSLRIWRLDTKYNVITEIRNISKKPPISQVEFFKIQLIAKPVPYSEYYLMKEERKKKLQQKK